MKKVLLVVCCLVSTVENVSADGSSREIVGWLNKISGAAQQLNYQGIFIYQHGNSIETSRITHHVDAQGEHEKLEALDGPPREIIRNNDEVMYFSPDQKIVKIEKRKTKVTFPALLIPAQFASLAENYNIKKSEPLRIIGFDCESFVLEPKDNLRYGHKLWADSNTGLLLKAKMVNEKNEIIEQFSFIQLKIGGTIDKEAVKPSYLPVSPEWHFDQSGLNVQSQDTGWSVKNQPVGFKKVSEMKRNFSGKSYAVSHLVFSDGLAAVSVFVEPIQDKANAAKIIQGISPHGALNVYTKPFNNYLITVVGEAPAATVMQIGNSVTTSAR